MPTAYKDTNLMILNVLRPRSESLKWHLCSEEVIKILKEIKPQSALITHFGMKMLPSFRREAQYIQEKTGVKTIAARDGMRYSIE